MGRNTADTNHDFIWDKVAGNRFIMECKKAAYDTCAPSCLLLGIWLWDFIGLVQFGVFGRTWLMRSLYDTATLINWLPTHCLCIPFE